MEKDKTLAEYEENIKNHTPDGIYVAVKFLLKETCIRLKAIEIELAEK